MKTDYNGLSDDDPGAAPAGEAHARLQRFVAGTATDEDRAAVERNNRLRAARPFSVEELLAKVQRSSHRFDPIMGVEDICDLCGNPLGHASHEHFESLMADRAELTMGTPRIAVICGSTRFRAEMAEVNRLLTLEGYIVLAPGVFAHDGDAITEEQKTNLDDLHLVKIDMASRVVVVNPGGYIGDSTRREIDYARERGHTIEYTEGKLFRWSPKPPPA